MPLAFLEFPCVFSFLSKVALTFPIGEKIFQLPIVFKIWALNLAFDRLVFNKCSFKLQIFFNGQLAQTIHLAILSNFSFVIWAIFKLNPVLIVWPFDGFGGHHLFIEISNQTTHLSTGKSGHQANVHSMFDDWLRMNKWFSSRKGVFSLAATHWLNLVCFIYYEANLWQPVKTNSHCSSCW